MTKLEELKNAISSIDTNDYARAIKALGRRPVSEIAYLKEYKPKQEILDEQIRKTKLEVGTVSASLTTLENVKLAKILDKINESLEILDEMTDGANIIEDTKKNLKKMKKHVDTINNCIYDLKNKLVELG